MRCLTETQQNLENAGTLLQSIEKRVESIEKTLGMEDYDLLNVCTTKEGRNSIITDDPLIDFDVPEDAPNKDFRSNGGNEAAEE